MILKSAAKTKMAPTTAPTFNPKKLKFNPMELKIAAPNAAPDATPKV